MKKIERFQGEYRWLSNFWEMDEPFVDIVIKDIFYVEVKYPTSEHLYQAMKINRASERLAMIKKHDFCNREAGQVKKISRSFVLYPGWDHDKEGIMYEIQRFKYGGAGLRKKLLSTTMNNTKQVTRQQYDNLDRYQYIEEGNTWGDTYWGICKGKGENHLGKIIMQVRNEIIAEMNGFDSAPTWQEWDYDIQER